MIVVVEILRPHIERLHYYNIEVYAMYWAVYYVNDLHGLAVCVADSRVSESHCWRENTKTRHT